ncbi:ATP synthase subunit delta [Burkholderiales bacterium GJ-E10]|nr:ATP synthase subunit delta [Burkholderiales bacterium GJ-E10]
MAELSTIARPYAEAFFEAAQAQGKTAEWLPALDALAEVASQPEVAEALGDPRLTPQQRIDLIAGLAGMLLSGQLPDTVAGLLRIAVENDRVVALPEIAAQVRSRKNEADGIADCVIESAYPMEPAQVAGLVGALAKKFPFQLKPEVRVDSRLIGGVRVTVGDRVMDNSVRARLDGLRIRLTA